MDNKIMDNKTNSSGSPEPTRGFIFLIVVTTLQIVAIILVVLGNSLVLVAVCRFKNLRNVTGKFVANLATADLVLGLSGPFLIVMNFSRNMQQDKTACLLRYELVVFSSMASLLSLFFAVLDRYLIIDNPFFYHAVMTDQRAYFAILGCWIYGGLVSFIPSYGFNNFGQSLFCSYQLVMPRYYRLGIALHFIVLSVLMFIIQLRIAYITHKHHQQIQSELSIVQDPNFQQATRMIPVLAIVILAFTLAWLPFSVIQILQFEQYDPKLVLVGNILVFLGIFNSTVNPFIYAWKNKLYRRAFKKILCCSVQPPELEQTLNIAPNM